MVKGARKTIDGRNCKSGCSDNPPPGKAGAPSAPEGAQLGQPEEDDEKPSSDAPHEGMPDDMALQDHSGQ